VKADLARNITKKLQDPESMTDETSKNETEANEPDYLARRRELMKKLAASAIATPAVLSSVTSKAAAASFPPPPPT
jgi:hypothetical protein